LNDHYGFLLRFKTKTNSGDKAFYHCKQSDCSIHVSLNTTTDTITDVRGAHQHENELLAEKIQDKVLEAKKKALEGASSKARAVYSELMANVQADPETCMGMVSFIIKNFLRLFLFFFIFL
jgi:hypothetical protein